MYNHYFEHCHYIQLENKNKISFHAQIYDHLKFPSDQKVSKFFSNKYILSLSDLTLMMNGSRSKPSPGSA